MLSSLSLLLILPYVFARHSNEYITKRQDNNDDSFQSCIAASVNATELTSKDGQDYTNASQPFNLRFTFQPDAIFFPSSTQQVSQIVTCASRSNLSVSTRSGGHSYAAYALAGDVVLDMSNLKSLTLNPDGTAVIQTGNKLGDVAQGLWNNGKRALPHGSCPYVGTGGHAGLGGYGFWSRLKGLLLDNIVSAEVVIGNGTILTASTTSNPSLFFSLLGAGPSFGVVTSWTFMTHPAPPTVVDFQINFAQLSQEDYTSALVTYQHWAMTAPNEIAIQAVMGPTSGPGGVFLSLQGDFYGSLGDFNNTIKGLMDMLPDNGKKLESKELDWINALVAKDGVLDTSKPDVHDTFYAKSLLVSEPSSNSSLAAFVKFMFEQGTASSIPWFNEIDMWGGAIASSSLANSSSFAHRNARFGYQLYSSSPNQLPPYPATQITFVNDMWQTLAGSRTEAQYTNYADPELTINEWPQAYYGDGGVYGELVQNKGVWDEGDVFRFNQSIPIPSKAGNSTTGTGNSGSSGPSGTKTGAGPGSTTAGQSTGSATSLRLSYTISMWLMTLGLLLLGLVI